MHLLKLFVAVTLLQVSFFWIYVSIKYQPARAAESEEASDEHQGTSPDGGDERDTTENTQSSHGARETSSGEHEKAQGISETSHTSGAPHVSVPYEVPDFQLLQYPHRASAERLNKDAVYQVGGKRYKFLEQKGREFIFVRIGDNVRIPFYGVAQFEVLNDPVAQLEVDLEVVPQIYRRASELYIDMTPHVTGLDNSVQALQAAATPVYRDASEEVVHRALEAMEQQFSVLEEELDTVTAYQKAIADVLRKGLDLCDGLRKRADRLSSPLDLIKKIRQVCSSLSDEMNTVMLERYDYAEAREKSLEKIKTIRRAAKLAADLQEVRESFRDILERSTTIERQLKTVVEEIETTTTKVTSVEEVSERQLRAAALKSTLTAVQKQVEDLSGGAGVLTEQLQLLMPLKQRCDQYDHQDILLLNEEIVKVRELGAEAETSTRLLGQLSQRAQGGVAALKEYTLSYVVMDSDLLHRGLRKVRADAASLSSSDLEVRVAGQDLSDALQKLMEAVRQSSLTDLESKLEDAQRQEEAYASVVETAKESLDAQLETARGLTSEMRRLEAFVTNAEEKKELVVTDAFVSERVASYEGLRQLAHSTTLTERFEAAMQQALTLPLHVAGEHLSEAEAKQTQIRALLASPSRDAGTIARLVETCHGVSDDIKAAAEVLETFRKCHASASVRGTLAKVCSGDSKPLADTLAEQWSELLKDVERIESSLEKLTAAVELEQQERHREKLVAMITPLLESVLLHAEELRRRLAEEEGAGAASGDANEVLEGLEALQDLLKSPNIPDFESHLQSSLVSVLKAALTSAAEHLQCARAAEWAVAQSLAGDERGRQPEDLADKLEDLPLEALAAMKTLQECLSLARYALAIYDGLKSVPNISSSLEGLPFSAGGISGVSLSAAAQVCEAEASTLIDRQKEIHGAIETHQARVRSRLSSYLKELLRLADGALNQLRSKEELATSEQRRTRIHAQEELYTKAREALFACMSASALRVKEAKACFLSYLKMTVSSATYAAEQAENSQREAEELYKSSLTDSENGEDINRACSLAVEEAELCGEALGLYFGSPVTVFVEEAADASSDAEGSGVSLRERANMVRAQLAGILDRVHQLREQVQTRSTAAAGLLRSSISQVLEIVRRGMEKVRTLASVQAGNRRVFVEIVQELENMLASVPASSDLPEHRRRFEDTTLNMKGTLLAVVERYLPVLKAEKAKVEACVHDATARPSRSFEDDTLRSLCQELPQKLRFAKVALNVLTEIGEVHGVPASSDSERGQQLLTETVSLEEQLRTLCDEATRQQESKTREAEQKLKMMKETLEETLLPAAQALSEAGQMGIASRLRQCVTSVDVLPVQAPSTSFPAALKQQQVNTLRLLTDIIKVLQNECNGHIAAAETVLNTPDPRLLLSVVRRTLEDSVRGSIFRSKDISDITRSLLKVYATIYGDQVSTTEEQPVGTGSSEDAIRIPERAAYFECTARAERIDAALHTVQKRLSEKVKALQEAGSHVVDKVAHGVEDALKKIDAENAGDMSPAPSCTDGEARSRQIKTLLEESLEVLRNPPAAWGTDEYAGAVRHAIGSVLTAVLEKAEMHLEAAKSKTPSVQTCVTEGTSCEDLGLQIDAEELGSETEQESNIKKHAEAASRWLDLYATWVSDEDTRDIASSRAAGPSSVPLPEWQVKLSTEARGLQEVAQELYDQINLRAASLTHLVETRVHPVLTALEKGVDMAADLSEDISNDEVIKLGRKLKHMLTDALAKVQELEKRLHRAASSSENEAQVAAVLSMLVTHASDLVEEGKSHEKSVLDCLDKSHECPDLLPATQALDALAACAKVSSITLSVFADCVKSPFSEQVARRTTGLSGVTLLQQADQLVKVVEHFDTRIPILASGIRNQRGRGTPQDYLARIVSLFASGFEYLSEVDHLEEIRLQQRLKECERLSDVVAGLQGVAIPPVILSDVKDLFKTALEEATRQVALAEERLQHATDLVEGGDMNIVTAQSLAIMKSSAEEAISEGLKRATAARHLLVAADRGVDESGKIRETLDNVAEAGDVGTAEKVLEEAEKCRSAGKRLREKLAYSEARAGELAAESLSGLMMVIKDVKGQLESEAVTRNCPEVVEPFMVRLSALLGLVRILRETWSFPSSVMEYCFLVEACAREFVKTASTNTSAARVLRDLAREHVERLRPSMHAATSNIQAVAEAFFEQGKNFLAVASVSLDGLWGVLTSGEVSRPGGSPTLIVALDQDVREKFVQQALRLTEQIAEVKEQLNLGELRGTIRAQEALLVDLATDRLNGIIGSLQASVDQLAERLEKLPSQDQMRRQQVSQEMQIYRGAIDSLTAYRDGYNFLTSTEHLYGHIVDVLSICVRSAQGNLDEGKGAAMQATVYLSSADLSSAQARKERALGQARNAVRHASESLLMAAMALDTFDNCARTSLVRRLADTVSDIRGGPSLQDKANSLRQRARQLSTELQEVKQQMANRGRDLTGGEEGGRSPVLEASDSFLPTPMGLPEDAPASTPGPVGQALEEATVEDLRLRLASAAGSLRSAEKKRAKIQQCIADATQCESMLSPEQDIVAVSDTVRARLMGPVLVASGQLKEFLAGISSAEIATGMTTAKASHEGAAASGVHEPAAGTSTSTSVLPASVRLLLELLDPSSEMLRETEGLLEATKKAEAAAVQASVAVKAVLVLRRLLLILARLLQQVEQEHTACDCAATEAAFFLKEECRLTLDNLAELERQFVLSENIDVYMSVMSHVMGRLLRKGKALVVSAKQAAGMAEDILTEATPGQASVTERISRVEKHVEWSSHQVSLTTHVVDSLSAAVQAVSLLQFSGGVGVAETGVPAAITSEIEQLSELAESLRRKLEDIRKRARELQQYAPSTAEGSVKTLIGVLRTTDQQLLKSIQAAQSDATKIPAQGTRIYLQALARSLTSYRQTPTGPGASEGFPDIVTAVGRALVHCAEVTLENAERCGQQISAHLDEGGDGSPDARRVTEGCAQISEQMTLGNIALRALETSQDIRELKHILSKCEPDQQVSVAEKAAALKEKAAALALHFRKLRELAYQSIYGSSRDPSIQLRLLSQTITETVQDFEQVQWIAGLAHPGVESISKDLLGIVAELESMGAAPPEIEVHDCAARAVQMAIQLASSLAQEAEECGERVRKCLSDREQCEATGDGADEMLASKTEVRAVSDLVDMARIALHLADLPEREKCFGSISEGTSLSLKDSAEMLSVKLEQLQALGRTTQHLALQGEETSHLEYKRALQQLCKALYMSISNVSLIQVPERAEKARTSFILLATSIMDSLQEKHHGISLEELRSAARRLLTSMLETAGDNIGDAEAKATKARERLESHTDEDGHIAEAEAYVGIAESALRPVHLCALHPLLQQLLIETMVEGGGTEQVVAQKQVDQLLQRASQLRTFLKELQVLAGSFLASKMQVIHAMIGILRNTITSLSGPQYRPSVPVRGKQAELRERLQTLEEAAQSGVGRVVQEAVSREVRAAVSDMSEALGDGGLVGAAAMVDQMKQLLKDVTERVGAALHTAEGLCAKGGVAGDVLPFSKFVDEAENAISGALTDFNNLGKDLEEIQRLVALDCDYAWVLHRTAEEYLGVKGIGAVLKDIAGSARQSFVAELEDTVHKSAFTLLQEREEKAQKILEVVKDLVGVATREQQKLQGAVAQVVPMYVQRLKEATEGLLAEGAGLSQQLIAVTRLAGNVERKSQGRSLTPPSGVGADVSLPNESQLSASELLGEVTTRYKAFKASLQDLSTRVEDLVLQIDEVLSLVQKRATSSGQVSPAPRRRLSENATLEGAGPMLLQLKEQLHELQGELSRMNQQAEDALKAASKSMSKMRSKATSKDCEGSGYLALALGIGLPIALLAMGGCAYYHYRRRQRKRIPDLASTSGSELQSSARSGGISGDLQVSRYDFGEADGSLASVDPSEHRGIRTLTSLETPDAGIPDTTQRQYMVDEHYVVATQMKEAALKKQEQFEHITFL